MALESVFAGINNLFYRREVGYLVALGTGVNQGFIHIQQTDNLGIFMNFIPF